MKKVIVIGEGSYIGTSFRNALQRSDLRQNYQVDTVSSKDNQWQSIDYGEYDAALLVAGIAHQKETSENSGIYDEINHKLAVKIASEAKQVGLAHFVFLSSMSVYGLQQGEINEQTPLSPNSAYGLSKAKAEKAILRQAGENFQVAVLRPPMVYGYQCPGNYARLSALAKKTKIFPNLYNQRSMIYIENLVEFIRLIIETKSSGIYCPQNTDFVSTSTLVKEIATVNNKKMYLSKSLGAVLKPLTGRSSLLSKIFGNLTYCPSLSIYPQIGEYNKVTFENSIEKSERNR